MSKQKVIEICKNLKQTLNNLTTVKNKVESKSTAYESTRARRNDLLKRKKELMNEYNLTEKDLK
jgi:septal ring factor EnvC (AmiA/AmiB activator)